MVKSSSQKKSDKHNLDLSRSQADELINYAADFIREWTQGELTSLADTKKIPVCWPLKSGGFKIGNDRIIPETKKWRRFDRNNEPKQLFSQKLSAIFYSLLKQTGYDSLAQRIEIFDRDMLRLENDIYNFEYCLKISFKEHNDFNITVYSSRLNNAKLQIKSARERLQKTLETAKYLKVWDQ